MVVLVLTAFAVIGAVAVTAVIIGGIARLDEKPSWPRCFCRAGTYLDPAVRALFERKRRQDENGQPWRERHWKRPGE